MRPSSRLFFFSHDSTGRACPIGCVRAGDSVHDVAPRIDETCVGGRSSALSAVVAIGDDDRDGDETIEIGGEGGTFGTSGGGQASASQWGACVDVLLGIWRRRRIDRMPR